MIKRFLLNAYECMILSLLTSSYDKFLGSCMGVPFGTNESYIIVPA